MLVLLAFPVMVVVATVHRSLQFYAPSNLLVRQVRAGQPRWRIVTAVLVLAASLLVAMHLTAQAVAAGAPGWLNLVVLLLGWDAIKLAGLATLTGVEAAGNLGTRGPTASAHSDSQ